jgi:hypothetical protein
LGGDIHGLDIDHCRNPQSGQLCAEAMVLLSRLGSWSEYSVSGARAFTSSSKEMYGESNLVRRAYSIGILKTHQDSSLLPVTWWVTLSPISKTWVMSLTTSSPLHAHQRKNREELKGVDYEQWAHLPQERAQEPEQREKAKQKTRKLHPDFNLEDFLKFYGLEVDNVTTTAWASATDSHPAPSKVKSMLDKIHYY